MEKKIIGKKISTLCKDKNVSISELVERSGLTEQQIERLLNSENIPTLGHLIKISRALGVRIGTFLDDSTEIAAVVFKNDTAIAPVQFTSQLSESHSNLHFTSLAPNKSGRSMEPFLIDITPALSKEKHLSSHEGEEFIYVLDGCIEIVYGNEIYVLQAGESIYYDSIVEHSIDVLSGQSAKILAVVYTPF